MSCFCVLFRSLPPLSGAAMQSYSINRKRPYFFCAAAHDALSAFAGSATAPPRCKKTGRTPSWHPSRRGWYKGVLLARSLVESLAGAAGEVEPRLLGVEDVHAEHLLQHGIDLLHGVGILGAQQAYLLDVLNTLYELLETYRRACARIYKVCIARGESAEARVDGRVCGV